MRDLTEEPHFSSRSLRPASMQDFASFDTSDAEPAPFVGIVGTTVDAIRLVIAARFVFLS